MRYKSNEITVTTDWTEIITDFTIGYLSIYPKDGDIEIQIKDKDGYGDTIKGFYGVAMEDVGQSAIAVRIKAVTGSVVVDYYFRALTEKY